MSWKKSGGATKAEVIFKRRDIDELLPCYFVITYYCRVRSVGNLIPFLGNHYLQAYDFMNFIHHVNESISFHKSDDNTIS